MSKDSVILYCHYYTLVNFLPLPLLKNFCALFTGALTLAATNPQYDKRFFIELQVQYMNTASSEHLQNLCTQHVLQVF